MYPSQIGKADIVNGSRGMNGGVHQSWSPGRRGRVYLAEIQGFEANKQHKVRPVPTQYRLAWEARRQANKLPEWLGIFC
jgi:hypothetical protein